MNRPEEMRALSFLQLHNVHAMRILQGMANTNTKSIEMQLREQGMRLADAGAGEPGWYVTVIGADGRPCKVWASDMTQKGGVR